jgi:hypothetical protein
MRFDLIPTPHPEVVGIHREANPESTAACHQASSDEASRLR